MNAAQDFVLASLAVVLQGIGDDAVNTFAEALEDAVAGGRITCAQDTEAMVNTILPGHPDEAVEVATLIDQLVLLVRASRAPAAQHDYREDTQ